MTSNGYRLLVTDIDGTLIREDGSITKETLEALALANRAGVMVSLCTGRSVRSCSRYVDELNLAGNYHIYFDGALVARPDLEEPVFSQTIEPHIIASMIEYAHENDIVLELATPYRFFAERETWSTNAKRRYFGIEPYIVDYRDLLGKEDIIRVDLAVKQPEEDDRTASFIDYFSGKLEISYAYTPKYPDVKFINIVARGLSKGKALEALASHIGIATDQVMAVGDWLNDIPLFETAGLSVAMGNAHEELKKIADDVTLPVNENGLAAAVRKYLLS